MLHAHSGGRTPPRLGVPHPHDIAPRQPNVRRPRYLVKVDERGQRRHAASRRGLHKPPMTVMTTRLRRRLPGWRAEDMAHKP